MNSFKWRTSPWQFRKKEKVRLQKALEAIEEIIRRGYECQGEASAARLTVMQLLNVEGRIVEHPGLDYKCWW